MCQGFPSPRFQLLKDLALEIWSRVVRQLFRVAAKWGRRFQLKPPVRNCTSLARYDQVISSMHCLTQWNCFVEQDAASIEECDWWMPHPADWWIFKPFLFLESQDRTTLNSVVSAQASMNVTIFVAGQFFVKKTFSLSTEAMQKIAAQSFQSGKRLYGSLHRTLCTTLVSLV